MRVSGLVFEFFGWVFVMLALWFSSQLAGGMRMAVFIALMAFGHHALANLFCSWISAFRFEKNGAKYLEIKNKFVRCILLRNIGIENVGFKKEDDNRINIIGFVLHVINFVLFFSFEIFLFLPDIPCEPYIFTMSLRRTRHGPNRFLTLNFELNCINEVVAAEGPRAFMIAIGLLFIVFVFIFLHRLEKHRRKIRDKKKYNPPEKGLKKTEWYYPLYKEITGIAVRRNRKKHRFWYKRSQLNEIEALVGKASEHAEIRIEKKRDKPISFTVVDTLNDHIVFSGSFI